MWKKLSILVASIAVIALVFVFFNKLNSTTSSNSSEEVTQENKFNPFEVLKKTDSGKLSLLSPFAKFSEKTQQKAKSVLAEKEVINILLIGVDRRSKSQNGFNTDTMILVSAKPKTNKVLLTSVPRDLWINGNKINALYTIDGPETLVDAFEQITGQKVDGYILTDFADFRWIIDAFGGVPVTVERDFTDVQFPNNSDTAVMSVTFNAGLEKMTGERALIFARSRKGSNGEGSDLMRAKRQHLILKAMTQAVQQPGSQFLPMNIQTFFQTVTAIGKMKTTLSLDDVVYLWDFYKDKDKYEVESFVIGEGYIYHPGLYPASDYHAWVFIPTEASWAKLHRDVMAKLDKTYMDPVVIEPTP